MSAPHDRPTPQELIDAVREWLESDVVDATEGRLRFHARVAANALAIAGRELEFGEAQADAHAARLAELGVADDAELAAAIRRGDYAVDDPRLLAALDAAVRDKLAVANPTYADDPPR